MVFLIESFPQMKYEEMEAEDNVSTVIQLVLLGFSDLPNLQGLLFGVFSIIYIIILTGNSLMIILTRLDPALQKPMYFFLSNFSSLEICYMSITLPRILVNFWTQGRRISILDCATQMCFFLILRTTECFLLVVMACDCCVAFCDPLHYPLVMTPKVCLQLWSWSCGLLGQWNSSADRANVPDRLSAFLSFEPDSPLLLWHSPNSEAGLQRHFGTWVLSLCSSSAGCCSAFYVNTCL